MTILTLSGWTQPSDALTRILPGAVSFDYSEYTDTAQAIDALSAHRSIKTVVAWSLGGWLAMQAIAAGTLAPASLVLIAPAFQFVNDGNFTDGMPHDTFTQFRQNYITDPERTLTRFHGLIAKGDKNMRTVMAHLAHHPEVANTGRWLPWLDALARDTLHEVRIDTPHITLLHGHNDAIVPVAQSTHIKARNPNIQIEIWQDACHAPHLHDSARFKETVKAAYAH